MRASREPMTVLQLKRSMDARFRRVDRRFDRLERRMSGLDGSVLGLNGRMSELDGRMSELDGRMRGLEDRMFGLEGGVRESEERLRRHFDVVVESIHDDMRIFAEAIGVHSDRFGDHERRLKKLERLT
jgi:SMC interacting uncharacterized protein involved in chromosome segregation